MSIHPSLRRLRRPIAAVLAVGLATAGVLAVASPASAASQTVTSGSASWGVKSSFRDYVINGAAVGSIGLAGGTTQAAGNGVFTFGSGTGAVDAAAGTADVDFAGSVRFLGHEGALDLTFTSPRLVAAGDGTGTIYVDYTGKSFPAGAPISGADVALATLTGVTLTPSGTTVAIGSATAVLTAAGAPAFGGFYPSGTVLDPISATVSVLVPAVSTTTTLGASPASPQLAGTSVTLTATVSPSAAAGSVQFLDGATVIGTVPVSAGSAVFPTTALSATAHALTATFVPVDSALFTGSSSSATPYTITAPPTAVTPVLGAVTGTSVQAIATDAATSQPAKAGNAVTLSVTVSDSAAGIVQFLDSGSAIGSPAPVAAGSASISISTLAAGPHSITAAFAPTDPAAFTSASTPSALAYRVASAAVPAACTADATGIAISGATASWPVSTYTRTSPWAPSASGASITSGATAFEFTAGTGFADVDCTVLTFTGSFIVANAAQGGITITFTNPTLIIGANGSGSMTADVSVHVNAAGQTAAVDTGPTRTTVATFTGANVTPAGGAVAFTVTPSYAAAVPAGSWAASVDYNSAFPGSLLFAMPSSVRAFFYQTGVTQAQLNKAAAPLTVAYPYPVVPTTTTLAATPSKPALVGAPVTLTATVTASTGSPVGSVSFLDGATVLGAVPVSAGIATMTLSSLAVGGHQLSAVFNGVAPFVTSSSTPAHYGIADPAAPAACAVNPAKALPITDGAVSWAVSQYVWEWTGNAVEGNVTRGASAFELTGGVGSTDGLCTAITFAATVTLSNAFYATVIIDNPTFSVAADGSGVLVGDVSSIVTAPGTPESTGPSRVVVATFEDAATAPSGNVVSFTVSPDFVGTVATGTFAATYGDAFPVPFVFAVSTQVQAFFYLSGTTAAQVKKPAAALSANWTLPSYAPQVSPSIGSVEQGQTVSFTGTGFAPNEPVSGVVNSDPVSLGSALASATGAVVFTWAVPADFAVGVHSIVLSGGNSGSSASATFEVVAPPVACVARTISGATLSWGVKSSFVSYINGPIAAGSYSTSRVTGQFTWSGGTGTANPASALAIASYYGSVSFTGHGGLLALTVANPTIQITGPTSALLLLDVTSKSLDSGVTTSKYGVAFATLSLGGGSNNSTADQIAYAGVPATLTTGGATVFAGFYGAGTALDAVSFALPLGADVPCTAAVDPKSSANLASTGVSVRTQGVLAVLVLSIGAGLMLIARRRTSTI